MDINKIATHPLQTKAWGEFREEWGNEILYTKYGLITVHKVPYLNFKLGIFLKGFMPTRTMLADLQEAARENNLIFIKLEPNYAIKKGGVKCADEKKVIKLLKSFGATPGKTFFTPTTFWIDLTKSEEELMSSFHKKTRYNIRLAERKGVKIKEDNSDKAFNAYIKLQRETVERQGFYAHTEKYHRLMWKVLRKAGIAHLLVARLGNEVVSAWVLFKWKGFLYYPYGASSTKHKNVMANNLMMWEAIKFGKRNKLKTFDLWGREPGKGFTLFKEGYNPEVVEFLGTWDLVINKPIYYLYKVAEKSRWALLRLKSRFTKPIF